MSLLCLFRMIWWSLECFAPISGHSYKEQEPEEGQPACVQILKCVTCGRTSVAWSKCRKCGA